MRITHQMPFERALTNLNSVQQRLAELQRQLSTGKRISRPSDAPADVTRALTIRADIKIDQQMSRNVDSGTARLDATEASLQGITEILQRARELAISAGNDTLAQSQRDQIAGEISGLLDEAIATGNFQFAGQYLFAGHKTTTVPFTATGVPPTAVAYNGDAGAIEREITIGERVTVNAPGDVALNDTFLALIQLRDDLLAGDANAIRSADIGALDSALGTVLELRGSLGATANRFMVTRNRLEDGLIRQREMLANTEDVDILEVIVNLSAQEAVFDAALASAARAVQNTLMDFLR